MTDSRKRDTSRFLQVADGAGVFGATFAALCCAGTPFIVAGLTALGLGFLKRDGILWPLMIGSLVVALWGFWRGWRFHHRVAPIALAVPSAASLIAGVIFVYGFPAMQMIWTAVAGLVFASAWNVLLRRRARRLSERVSTAAGA